MAVSFVAGLSVLGLLMSKSSAAALGAVVGKTINATAEYSTPCQKCPYLLCPTVSVPDTVTVSCWTNGQLIGDSGLWLKTEQSCYVSEFDLVEYSGDFSAELPYCGRVPLDITRQLAKVRYLSECKWEPSTSSKSNKFYGRDLDVTLVCWGGGGEVMGDKLWYKTTDNCYVSGSGLWGKPDRSRLNYCGETYGPYINETKRDIEPENKLEARWLQPEQIGEEYAPCYSCPAAVRNATCHLTRRYEYNQTVVSQCLETQFIEYENGTFTDIHWMLTTDWCYVDGNDFWIPPWDNYRYPRCSYWNTPSEEED